VNRTILTVCLFACFGAFVAHTQGQQPAGRGAARGGFVLGADPMPGTASEHLGKLKLPAGFSVALYADNVAGARSMALGSDGTVFVGTRAQTVYAVVDRNKDFKADEVLTLANGLTSPNGVAFRDGALYVAENSRISRYDGVLDFAKVAGGSGPAPKQTVLTDKLPPDRMHGWKYLTFGPDGLLYSAIGAPGNVLDRGDPYATIIRMKPEPGTQWEIFARGVRNTVGYTWHPDTREM
jgi:glucose/arabinose dehydrogenase